MYRKQAKTKTIMMSMFLASSWSRFPLELAGSRNHLPYRRVKLILGRGETVTLIFSFSPPMSFTGFKAGGGPETSHGTGVLLVLSKCKSGPTILRTKNLTLD